MMPTLVAFMRAYPEIVLDLDFSDRVVDVIEEGFDVNLVGPISISRRTLVVYSPVTVFFGNRGCSSVGSRQKKSTD
jgi:DNA-binding transcriptional LysR family regulator